jgi:Putative zinc-finger
MIHQHLQGRAMATEPMLLDMHLDEDALNAFVEGRLSDRESAPLIKHLVACGYCRHATSQLVRLDAETGQAGAPMPGLAPEEPGLIRRLLEDLAARVLPSSQEDAVFAYHAPAEDFQHLDEASADKPATAQQDEPAQPGGDSDPSA